MIGYSWTFTLSDDRLWHVWIGLECINKATMVFCSGQHPGWKVESGAILRMKDCTWMLAVAKQTTQLHPCPPYKKGQKWTLRQTIFWIRVTRFGHQQMYTVTNKLCYDIKLPSPVWLKSARLHIGMQSVVNRQWETGVIWLMDNERQL